MFCESTSEAMHLLMAVHLQGDEFYLSQIEGIINHYGEDIVLKAENSLYKSRAFQLCMAN